MEPPNTTNEWRECPQQTVMGKGYYKRQTSSWDQYGYCVIEVGPLLPGEGFVFENLTTEKEIPLEFIPAVEEGVKAAMGKGIANGYPITDVYVAVVDGAYHEIDSREYSFKVAGTLAFQDACSKAEMVILEPITTVTITTPQQFANTILDDLQQRRGEIVRQEALLNDSFVIEASVPLSEILGYSKELSEVTSNKAIVTITPNGYSEVPSSIADSLRTARKTKEPQEPIFPPLPVQRLPKRKRGPC